MASEPKNVKLKRYEDGVPSVLRKQTLYTELHFYRKSDVLVQLTKVFCQRFLPRYGDRTVDQMVQAARSIKQNIAEGFTDGVTSSEVELKLLGIATGSNRELLEDYQDYLKQRNLPEWALAAKMRTDIASGNKADAAGLRGQTQQAEIERNAERYNKLRAFCKEHSDLQAYEPFFMRWTDEEMVNCAVCLCHMVDKAITSFIEKRDREFVEQGGIRERMTAARLDYRGTQKEIIEAQAQEINRLKALVASLQREIETLKANSAGGR